jgi:hypothetical protein
MQPKFEANTIDYLRRRQAIAALASDPFADRIAAAIEVLNAPAQTGLGDK